MPDVPSIVAISNRYKAQLRAQEANALRRMATVYGSTARRINSEMAALRRDIEPFAAKGGPVPEWRVLELERYQRLMAQTEVQLHRAGEIGAAEVAKLQAEGIRIGVASAEASVKALMPPGVSIPFVRMPTGAVETMIGNSRRGSPLRALFDEYGTEASKRIESTLARALSLGWNPRKTAAMLHKELGIPLNRMAAVARTEQLRAYRQSSIEAYRDQKSLIKGYRRVASLDDRTCVACILENGRFYELEEDFTDHIMGRCAVIPVTRSWEELGFHGVPDTNPEVPSGREWLLRQDEATQRTIMGPGIFDAWKSGRISLDDMSVLHRSAAWGDSYQPASLSAALRSAADRRGVGAPAPPNAAGGAPKAQAVGNPSSKHADVRAQMEAAHKEQMAKLGSLKKELETVTKQLDEGWTTWHKLPTYEERAKEAERINALHERSKTLKEDVKTAYENVKERQRSFLWANDPVRFRCSGAESGITQYTVNTTQAHATKLGNMLERRSGWWNGVDYTIGRAETRRAYAWGNRIYLKDTSENRVLHELGHTLEFNDGRIANAAQQFLERRTFNEAAIPMAEATGNAAYGASEITKADRFADAYMGRQYVDADGIRYATEVVSMGFEKIYANPLGFAREDPEHFDFIYDILKGTF